MLSKFYLGVGIVLCVGLGILYAMKIPAPNLGIFDGSGGGTNGSGGRSGGGFFFSSFGSGK